MIRTTAKLFRQDAVEAFARRGLGAPIGAHHRPAALAALLLLLPVAGLTAIAVAGKYQPRMTVSGRIITGSGEVEVAADRSGVVKRLLLEEGDPVRRGDALMAVGSNTGNADQANLDDAQRQILLAELEHLNGLRDLLSRKSASWIEGYDLEGQSARRELGLIESLQSIAQKRANLLTLAHDRIKHLSSSGHAPRTHLDASELQVLEAQMQVFSLEREHAAFDARLQQRQVERTAALNRFRDEELDLQIRSAQLHRQLLDLESRAESLLLSPAIGRIGVLLVRTGASVAAGQPVVSIVPANQKPSAELLVPSAHISLIAPGHDVRLRYAGLPMQRFGTFSGEIVDIGPTPVSRSVEHGPLYRVIVELNHPMPVHNGRNLRLFPGSSLEADILGPPTAVWRRLLAPLRRSGLLP